MQEEINVPEVQAVELIDNPKDKEVTEEDLKDIANSAKFQQMWHQAHTPWVRKNLKINRNDPCPCGSGKKFKNCCIDNYKSDYSYVLSDDPTYSL